MHFICSFVIPFNLYCQQSVNTQINVYLFMPPKHSLVFKVWVTARQGIYFVRENEFTFQCSRKGLLQKKCSSEQAYNTRGTDMHTEWQEAWCKFDQNAMNWHSWKVLVVLQLLQVKSSKSRCAKNLNKKAQERSSLLSHFQTPSQSLCKVGSCQIVSFRKSH